MRIQSHATPQSKFFHWRKKPIIWANHSFFGLDKILLNLNNTITDQPWTSELPKIIRQYLEVNKQYHYNEGGNATHWCHTTTQAYPRNFEWATDSKTSKASKDPLTMPQKWVKSHVKSQVEATTPNFTSKSIVETSDFNRNSNRTWHTDYYLIRKLRYTAMEEIPHPQLPLHKRWTASIFWKI
jgi:hypothetical protein